MQVKRSLAFTPALAVTPFFLSLTAGFVALQPNNIVATRVC